MLQQASNLTNGLYFKVPQITGLLHYLLWIFLPNENLRKMLVLIPKTQVDFRAACFCHRQLIDIGFVCSVCLSVFCSFTPICSTCDCNFEFDLNILKLGKKIDFIKKSSQIPMDSQSNDSASILQDRQNEARNQQQQQQVTTSIISAVSNVSLRAPAQQSRNLDRNFIDDFEMLE